MLTVVLLVVMRLAIGCHFFYEGVWKIKHADEFSAVPLITMAKGPAADLFYAMVYDLNGRQRLKVEDLATANGLVVVWRRGLDDTETRYRAELEKAKKKDRKEIDQAVAELRGAILPVFREHQDLLEKYVAANERDMIDYFTAGQPGSIETVKAWLSEIGNIERQYIEALMENEYVKKDNAASGAIKRSVETAVPSEEDIGGFPTLGTLVDDKSWTNTEGKKVLNVTIRVLDVKEKDLYKKEKKILYVGVGARGEPTLSQWGDLRDATVRKYGLTAEQQVEAQDAYSRYEMALGQYLAICAEDIVAYLGSLDRSETEKAAGNNGAAFQRERAWVQMTELRQEAKGWLTALDGLDQAYQEALWQTLTDRQKDQGELPQGATRDGFFTWSLTWGLTAIGLCLLLGFCTRLACLGGVGFLLFVLLNQPPWPTIYPPAPPVVGHALLVDKNFVEIIAMLVLATTAVGRWGGLDHFVYRYLGEPILKRLNK